MMNLGSRNGFSFIKIWNIVILRLEEKYMTMGFNARKSYLLLYPLRISVSCFLFNNKNNSTIEFQSMVLMKKLDLSLT